MTLGFQEEKKTPVAKETIVAPIDPLAPHLVEEVALREEEILCPV
jgi:hypothetical protein